VQSRECGYGRGFEAGPEPREEAGETNASGGDGERRGKAKLPDIEEAQPVPRAVGAIDFAEECVGATGPREGCAEFGPYEAVCYGNGGAEEPGPYGKLVSGCGDDERERDEGAYADHLEHVEEDG